MFLTLRRSRSADSSVVDSDGHWLEFSRRSRVPERGGRGVAGRLTRNGRIVRDLELTVEQPATRAAHNRMVTFRLTNTPIARPRWYRGCCTRQLDEIGRFSVRIRPPGLRFPSSAMTTGPRRLPRV
jgi:hypothetical protein